MKKFILLAALATFLPLVQGPVAYAADPFFAIPVRVRMVLEKVSRLMERQDFTQAIALLENFQSKGAGPTDHKKNWSTRGYDHPLIDYSLGNCYLQQQQYRQAARAYEQALKKNDAFVAAWQTLAKSYYQLQQYDDAARCFLAVAGRDTEHAADNRYYAAVSLLLAKRYDDAVRQFDQLFEQQSHQLPLAWQEHYVQALLAAGQGRRALPFLQELVKETTSEARMKWQEVLLDQYLQLGMQSEARAYAKGLTHENCTCAKWWKALTHIELAEGNDEEALAALTIYRFLSPLSENEKKLWADLNLQLNIPSQALPEYHRLLDEKPDPKIIRKLILAYRQLGQDTHALQQLQRYAPATEDGDLLMVKADLQYSLGNYAEAAATYRQVAHQQGQNGGQAWLMAGYAAWQSEDFPASLTAFDHAAANKDQRQAALAAINKLQSLN